MSIIIHGTVVSPFVRKVFVALEEKGIAYEKVDARPFPRTEELFAKSPLGKIPFMEVEGTYIPDSSVICQYLERTHPSPALYPSAALSFARALFLEEYADTKVFEITTAPFFQRFVRPRIFKEEPDEPHIREVMENELPPVLDYLSGELGDDDFLIDNQFCIADIAVCSPFVNMQTLGSEHVDAERWPKFSAYLERVLSRPAYKTAVAGLPDPKLPAGQLDRAPLRTGLPDLVRE